MDCATPLSQPAHSMNDRGRRVVLDAESIDLRRALGPTAWVVFEELLLV